MKLWGDSGKVQNKLIKQLERQERQQVYLQEKFLRFKLSEIHSKLAQELLLNKVIETDNPASISNALLNGLKKALKSTEFDFQYFISPLRDLLPRPDPYSLYMTQYILEIIINGPDVIDIYGTDIEIYNVVNKIFSQINEKYKRDEAEVKAQLAHNNSMTHGSREYEIELDRLMQKKMGEPHKDRV